ncbi:MAG TPA: SHOCT domain-containing protein [Actinomycetota bacterium]|nr:SHOCT domain-containing protein [Actinomycetota bacterium]
MRPNKVGWFIVAFFLIGGIMFWISIPQIFIGQIWVAVSLFLLVLYTLMNRSASAADKLRATGIRGEAAVLQMTQTGTYVNNQPRVKLKLRVTAPHIAPFEDEKTVTVPMIALGRLNTGAPLTVYMKSDDPHGYVIDWFDGAGGGTPITVHRSGEDSMTIGHNQAAGAAVLDALKKHGVDPTSGNIDLRNMPEARAAVLRALQDHRVDAAHQVAARDSSTPIEDPGQPMERLLKLQQLRDANLITPDEYETQRQRIINEL